jgi:hypothetical protein
MDIKKRAEIFMEETANSNLSTVFAANMVIRELLCVLIRYETALHEIADRDGIQSGVGCAMVAHEALYIEQE